ncbi:hypothetical protein LTR96_011676, partial [Exophiala xenobiotica]
CPDCQRPVRQYTTQRYNRVVNRAVINEMSRRFLVNGKTELSTLELRFDELEKDLEKTRSDIVSLLRLDDVSDRDRAGFRGNVTERIQARYESSRGLNRDINSFLRKTADCHQPAPKLYEAQLHAARARRTESLDQALRYLDLRNSVDTVNRDRRVTLGGRMIQIKTDCAVLEDKFAIANTAASSAGALKLPGGSPDKLTKPYLDVCATFIEACKTDSLAKLAVEGSLYFARVARLYQSSRLSNSGDEESEKYVERRQESY